MSFLASSWSETQSRSFHLPSDDAGPWRRVELVVALNASTDPHLAERALQGTLHVQPDGSSLAVPFVFHNPEKLLFALVVPAKRAHETLALRAELFLALSKASTDLPDYVANAQVVIDVAGLKGALSQETPAAPLSEKPATFDSSSFDAREEDLRAEEERLAALRRSLDERAEALKAREASIVESAQSAARPTSSSLPLAAKSQPIPSRPPPARLPSYPPPPAQPVSLPVPSEDELLLAVTTDPGDLVDSVEMVDGAVQTAGASVIPDHIEDDEIEDVDEGMFTEIVSDEHELVGAERRGGSTGGTDVLDADDLIDDGPLSEIEEIDEELEELASTHLAVKERVPAPAGEEPPDDLLTDMSTEMLAVMDAEANPRLFVRLQEGREESFDADQAELRVQYLEIDDVPVVLLVLVEDDGDRPYARRAALDPRSTHDAALLERLKENHPAKVSCFGPTGDYLRTTEASLGDRAPNLAYALERANAAAGGEDAAIALERALAAPPPLRLRGHPFEESPAATKANQAFEDLGALSKWAAPAKVDLAVLGLCVPKKTVDDTFARVLDAALRFGLALPEALEARAIQDGLAKSPESLVQTSLTNFAKVAGAPEHGLDGGQTSQNWNALLERAESFELPLSEEVYGSAARTQEALPTEIPAAIKDADDDALARLLLHPKVRAEAGVELLDRGGEGNIEAVIRGARRMSHEDLLNLAPALSKTGEPAVDGLLELFGASRPHVRQAAAFSLSQLKVRRAIGPLLRLVRAERTEVWREVARLFATQGSGVVRPLIRAIKEDKGDHERLAMALAFLKIEDPDIAKQVGKELTPTIAKVVSAATKHGDAAKAHLAAIDSTSDAAESSVEAFSGHLTKSLKS